MYKFNIMIWGNVSPDLNHITNGDPNKLNVWKCNFNKYGIITSCKLVKAECENVNDIGRLKDVYMNVQDCRDVISTIERSKFA